jgi:hypothetical protein
VPAWFLVGPLPQPGSMKLRYSNASSLSSIFWMALSGGAGVVVGRGEQAGVPAPAVPGRALSRLRHGSAGRTTTGGLAWLRSTGGSGVHSRRACWLRRLPWKALSSPHVSCGVRWGCHRTSCFALPSALAPEEGRRSWEGVGLDSVAKPLGFRECGPMLPSGPESAMASFGSARGHSLSQGPRVSGPGTSRATDTTPRT